MVIEDDLEKLRARAQKMAEDAASNAKEKIDSLQDSEEWQEVRKMALGLAKESAEIVRKYPLQSVLGAAAAGFLLSSLLNRRR